MIPSDRLATDVGRHFRQTPIEFTKDISKKTGEFNPDRHQQVPLNRHWQKETGENQLGQTLIKPIRQTLTRKILG